jgi:lipoprotein-anchoring transpeptidase ErfK/SrfK
MRAIRAGISAVAAAAAVALAVTGCTGSTTTIIERSGGSQSPGSTASGTAAGGTATASASASPSATPSPAGPGVTIAPGGGDNSADPSKGITVSSPDGKLAHVTVTTAGDPVTGTFAADHSSWHSDWALNVSQSYTVTAIAVGSDGARTTKTSTFRTLTPAGTFSTHIFEGFQQTYGVGMPIILTFSSPIQNKAAVERAIELRTSRTVVGAWYWDGTQTLVFRPRDYWPAHSTVSFTGHFDGVQAAPGLYGYHTLTQTFNIGDSVIAVASTRTHRTQIYINGHKKYDWPVSTGKTGDDTPNGSYLSIEKANPVRMTGPGYDLLVPWSVRFTFSGDYYHDAYWSTGQQGFENVSHGCVNLAPANAKTYYELSVPGNPITIKGSPRPGTWGNGWTEWFLTWPQLLKGSATGQAVVAGPHGSQFVSPGTLAASKATYPIGTAQPGSNI